MNKNITVIIPTMNRNTTLINTLKSLIKAIERNDEIIIIDQTNDLEKQKKNKEDIINILNNKVRYNYIYQKKPSSTIARNTGIDNSKNDILVFMDDDVEFEPDILEKVKNIMNDKKIALIAGIDELTDDSNSKFGYIFGMKSFKRRNCGHVIESMFGRYPNKTNNIVYTEWAMGYFFVVRKNIILENNIRFDENLSSYAYAEDLDFTYTYCKVSKKNNMISIIHPNVHVRHLCSKEFRVSSFKSTCMYVINREYLSYKHFKSSRSRIMTRWANIGEFIKRIIMKNRPLDLIKAQIYCDINRKKIKNGKIPKKIYENTKWY